jgi:zinc protease
VQLPKVYMSWLTPAIYQPGDAESDLLAQILGGSKSSRLYEALVYDRKIAQDVSVYQQSLMLGSVFGIEATAKPGVKPEDLEKAIDDELAKIRRDGPTQEELDRARNTIEAGIIRGLERLGGFGGVADRLNQYNHFLGDPGYLGKDLARYRNATREGLQRLAAQDLVNEKRVVVYGVPGPKVTKEVPRTRPEDEVETQRAEVPRITGQEWRAQIPKPAAASRLNLPEPQRFQLANGLTVLLVEQHKLPIVSANLVVLAGSEANPADKPGLASFTADMLDEGTANRSALQISADADRIGATLGTGSSSDSSSASVRTLRQHADAAFDLLADVTLRPAFSQNEIDRRRNDRLTSLVQSRDDPNTLASMAFSQLLYGSQHPYGFAEIGTEASIRTLRREDLVGFWRSGYTPDNAALVVAGDITATELRALAEKHFGGWTGKAALPKRPEVREAVARGIVIVDRPSFPQTALRVGQVSVPRSNPDYVPLQVMNVTLGGLFASRINMNLREKNGFTYGAGSNFSFRRGPGPFGVATSVRADATAPAVREIFTELERMHSGGVTQAELDMARDSYARSLPGAFETTPQTAATIGQLFVYGLPLDYYRGLPARIQAVSTADVGRVAAKYLAPDRMSVVAVGDRSVIEAGLKALEIGPVQVRDAESLIAGGPPKAAAN